MQLPFARRDPLADINAGERRNAGLRTLGVTTKRCLPMVARAVSRRSLRTFKAVLLGCAAISAACSSGDGNAASASAGGEASVGGNMTGGATYSLGGSATNGDASTGDRPIGGASATGGGATAGGNLASNSASGGASNTIASTGSGASGSAAGIGASGGSFGTGGNGTGGAKATAGAAASAGTTSVTGGSAAVAGGPPVTGTNAATITVPKFVGNITTGYSSALDFNNMTFYRYWDQVTPENAGKWGSVQSSASAALNWSALDAIYKYTQTNNVIFKEHNFVWGPQQPTGSITQANVENWIKSFCQRYPNTKLIDVVNEPPPHTTPAYAAALGAGESGTYGWITKAFKLARQYCGSAILILNDYNNIEFANEQSHFVNVVTQVTAAGGPIDAVGAQAHSAYLLSAATLQANLDTLHGKTGLPVYITEYDVSTTSDSSQLSTYQAQFPVFWNTNYVRGITIWGWIVGYTWSQAPNSGLVNTTSPRPAMTWLMQQLGRPIPPN